MGQQHADQNEKRVGKGIHEVHILYTGKGTLMIAHIYRLGEVLSNPYRLEKRFSGPLYFDSIMKIWICTGYLEAEVILRNQKAFTASRLRDRASLRARGLHSLATIHDILKDQLLFLDGASHRVLRTTLQKRFTTSAVTAQQAFIQALVDEHLDRLPKINPIDLIADYAAYLPVYLSAHLLGLPSDDLPRFIEWNEAYEEALASCSGFLPEEIVPILEEEMDYFRDVIRQRRSRLGEDQISDMINSFEDDDEDILKAIAANCIMLLAGGYQTATNLIAQGLVYLTREPRYRHLLRDDPKAIMNETMRLEGSSQYIARQALHDVSLAGETIRAGQTILVLLAAANRDERVFLDAETFQPSRWTKPSKPHLGFSVGHHFCLGAPYAEALSQRAMQSFIHRFPNYEVLEGRIVWGSHTNVHCPRHVPVQLHPV